MKKKLVILGSGGYGRTIFDIAEQLGYEVVVLNDSISGCPLASFSSYIEKDTCFIPAFGNNEFRISWCDRITAVGGKLATLIHPTAYVSPCAVVEEGSVILPHAVVNTGVKIGKGYIINLQAVIDHDCIIEGGYHICLSAIVKGENHIGRCEKVEAGVVIERTFKE